MPIRSAGFSPLRVFVPSGRLDACGTGTRTRPRARARRASSERQERCLALLLAAALASALPAASATASGPTLTVTIGDGSVYAGQAPVALRLCGTSLIGYGGGSVPFGGSITLPEINCCAPCNDAAVLLSPPSPYFRTPWKLGVIHCTTTPGVPSVCSGSYTGTVYSRYGSITGSVTRLPEGTPAAGVDVFASVPDDTCHNNVWTLTDAEGRFSYRDPTAAPNNWGLQVDGDGSGPGSRDYFVSADFCRSGSWAMVASNVNVEVDLTVTSEYFEDPSGRPCSSASAPNAPPAGPSAEGLPVSVLNGNVFFDQTDITLPGVALGGLTFTRAYNSQTSDAGYGAFGPGWNHVYERRLSFPAPNVVMLRNADGMPQYFQDSDGDTLYRASVPFTEISSLAKQADGGYVRAFPSGGSESYGADGRLQAITDAAGNAVTLTYSGDHLTTITDPGGRALTLSYTGERITSISGPAGLIASYAYDSLGRLVGATYPDSPADPDSDPDGGYVFEYDLDSAHLWQVKDLTGRILETHLYNADGKAETSEVSGGIEKYTFIYEPHRTLVTSRRSPDQAQDDLTIYEWASYHGLKRVTRITGPCGLCGPGTSGDVQEWAYDAKGRVVSYKDGAGNVTTYEYDPQTGDLLTERRPLGHTTQYTYYPDRRTRTITRPNGRVTTYTYVAAGVESVRDTVEPEHRDRLTSFTYTSRGQIETTTDPRGKVTTFAYDATGDLRSITDPLGAATPDPNDHTTRFESDALGRRTASVDPLGQRTETEYDALGRVTKTRRFHHDNGTTREIVTTVERDQGGRRKRFIDPLGRVTDYTYDAYGRLLSVDEPEAVPGEGRPRTTYGYDLMSNLASLTDAEQHTTTFRHDAHRRIESVRYPGPELPEENFTYDSAGRLSTATDRRGITTTYGYDALGRITTKSFSDSTPPVTYTYDEHGDLGALTSAQQEGYALRWDYDLLGQMRREQAWRGATLISTIESEHDAAGNRVSVALDGQIVARYAYDDASRLTTLSRGQRVFAFEYDDAHRRTSLALPNGVTQAYEYDDLGRLEDITANLGPAPVARSVYTYDDADNRLSKTHFDHAETYALDALGRLTSVHRDGTLSERYGYDRVGNRKSTLITPEWAYNERNELLSTGTQSFEYDANGNQTRRTEAGSIWFYEWDAENRLKRVVEGGAEVARFRYDPLGRRIEKTATGVTTGYVYDGEDIVLVDDPTSTGTARLWIHGPGIDEPLAAEDKTGGWTYEHADGLGSELKQTDDAGSVITSRTYDAWGRLEAGAAQPGYAFTGREWDPETGLYYYRARYYDPRLGRFISADPLPAPQRTRDELNGFIYVGDKPIGFTDPEGYAKFTNNSSWAIPYKPESEDYQPPKFCMPGEICDVDGVYSPPGSGGQCIVKMPDFCRGAIDATGKVSIRCLIKSPAGLGPADLDGASFRNWPDPYSGRHWPYGPWDPNRGCTCPSI